MKNKLLSWFTDYVLFQVKETEEFFPEYILKIFRVKGKENFYLEITNGKVEVVYNGRRRKKLKK